MSYRIKSNLRIVMAQKGIRTLKEVIDMTDLSKPTIMKIEQGNSNVVLDSLFKVCEALGCTFDELITIEKI